MWPVLRLSPAFAADAARCKTAQSCAHKQWQSREVLLHTMAFLSTVQMMPMLALVPKCFLKCIARACVAWSLLGIFVSPFQGLARFRPRVLSGMALRVRVWPGPCLAFFFLPVGGWRIIGSWLVSKAPTLLPL